MLRSAKCPRTSRRHAIVRAAQDLAVQRGLTGFTLDDLAEQVGVSRRTLFNHIGSKEEAVLGSLPTLDEPQIERLRTAHPDRPLLEDVVATILDACLDENESAEGWTRLQDVLDANPELHARLAARVDDLVSAATTHLATRPGVTPAQARTALQVGGALLHCALDACLADPSAGSLAERAEEQLELLRQISRT